MNTFDINTPMIERHRNLRTLMNFISDLPHDKFVMPTWCSSNATEHSCGTAGCAAGWAVTLFHKQGFRFVARLENITAIPVLELPDGSNVLTVKAFALFFGIDFPLAYFITSYLSLQLNESLHRLTGMNLDEYYQLIRLGFNTPYIVEYDLLSASEITPVMAAHRIRKVLEYVAPDVLKEEECTSIQLSQQLNGEVSCENLQSSCPS